MDIRSKIVLGFALLLTLMIGANRQAAAAPGSFDTTFGFGGLVYDTLPKHPDFELTPVATVQQPDGKTLVAGRLRRYIRGNFDNNYYVLLRRYNSDGSVDTQFGVDGFASQLGLGFNPVLGFATSVTVQLDGTIVVGGSTLLPNYREQITLWRFRANGFSDQSYGSGGTAVLVPTANGHVVAIATYSTKTIVAATTVTSYAQTALLGRVNPNGTLDTTFKGGFIGVGSYDPNLGTSTGLYAINGPRSLAIQNSNGDIYLSGRYFYQSYRLGLVKFDQNGNVSTGYGTNGAAFTPSTLNPGDCGSYTSIYNVGIKYSNVLLYPDGRVAVTGQGIAGSVTTCFVLTRYGVDGFLDPTFLNTGFSISEGWSGYSAALQSDGKIVYVKQVGTSVGLLRLSTSGMIDTTYTTALIDFGSEIMTIQPDDKIVSIGTFDVATPYGLKQRIMLGRYLP